MLGHMSAAAELTAVSSTLNELTRQVTRILSEAPHRRTRNATRWTWPRSSGRWVWPVAGLNASSALVRPAN